MQFAIIPRKEEISRESSELSEDNPHILIDVMLSILDSSTYLKKLHEWRTRVNPNRKG